MSKRPLDTNDESVSKKVRVNPELEAMKATLESLMKTADEHHEEARIAAIDTASELEEQWIEANATKDKTETEYDAVSSEYDTAVVYLENFENSATVQMLKKASENKTVDTLVEDHEKINDTLTKMRNLQARLLASKTELHKTLQEQIGNVNTLKSKLTAAESKVDIITSFK